MLKNVFVNNYGGSFLNPDGPDLGVSNLGQRTPLHDDESLGLPLMNFDDTQNDSNAPTEKCGCGKAVKNAGPLYTQYDASPDDPESLGIPVWNFDKDD